MFLTNASRKRLRVPDYDFFSELKLDLLIDMKALVALIVPTNINKFFYVFSNMELQLVLSADKTE